MNIQQKIFFTRLLKDTRYKGTSSREINTNKDMTFNRIITEIYLDHIAYRVRQNYDNQGLMERYKFTSLSAINLTRG